MACCRHLYLLSHKNKVILFLNCIFNMKCTLVKAEKSHTFPINFNSPPSETMLKKHRFWIRSNTFRVLTNWVRFVTHGQTGYCNYSRRDSRWKRYIHVCTWMYVENWGKTRCQWHSEMQDSTPPDSHSTWSACRILKIITKRKLMAYRKRERERESDTKKRRPKSCMQSEGETRKMGTSRGSGWKRWPGWQDTFASVS